MEAVALAELEAAAEEFDAAVAVLCTTSSPWPPPAPGSRRCCAPAPGSWSTSSTPTASTPAPPRGGWLGERRRAAAVGAHPAGEEAHAHAALTPEGVVADLRAHVHPLAGVLEALHPWFALGEPVRGPYLHRWHLPPGLPEAEEALIATGALPATGARVVAVRREGAQDAAAP